MQINTEQYLSPLEMVDILKELSNQPNFNDALVAVLEDGTLWLRPDVYHAASNIRLLTTVEID